MNHFDNVSEMGRERRQNMETAMDRLQRHEEKIKEASHRILAISNEMQLTWNDFEQVLSEIKKRAYLIERS